MDNGIEHTSLELACKKAGGASALARHLKITPQAVLQWPRVPAERVLEVEAHTGVSRHHLRPDIFGPASTQERLSA